MEGCCLLAHSLVYSLALSLAHDDLAFISRPRLPAYGGCHPQWTVSTHNNYQPSQFLLDITTWEFDSLIEVLPSQVILGFVKLAIELTRTLCHRQNSTKFKQFEMIGNVFLGHNVTK